MSTKARGAWWNDLGNLDEDEHTPLGRVRNDADRPVCSVAGCSQQLYATISVERGFCDKRDDRHSVHRAEWSRRNP